MTTTRQESADALARPAGRATMTRHERDEDARAAQARRGARGGADGGAALRVAWTLVALLALSGCELSANSTLGFWCDDALCDWEVESGAVTPAPTWHEASHGVRMESGVAMSQVVERAIFTDDCLEIDVVADLEGDARLVVELDLGDSGEVDNRLELADADWALQQILTRLGKDASALRLRLRLEGEGAATIGKFGLYSRSRTDERCEAAARDASR